MVAEALALIGIALLVFVLFMFYVVFNEYGFCGIIYLVNDCVLYDVCVVVGWFGVSIPH